MGNLLEVKKYHKKQVKILFTEEKQKVINEKIKELEQLMK